MKGDLSYRPPTYQPGGGGPAEPHLPPPRPLWVRPKAGKKGPVWGVKYLSSPIFWVPAGTPPRVLKLPPPPGSKKNTLKTLGERRGGGGVQPSGSKKAAGREKDSPPTAFLNPLCPDAEPIPRADHLTPHLAPPYALASRVMGPDLLLH